MRTHNFQAQFSVQFFKYSTDTDIKTSKALRTFFIVFIDKMNKCFVQHKDTQLLSTTGYKYMVYINNGKTQIAIVLLAH